MVYFNNNITMLDEKTSRIIFNTALNEELRAEIVNVGADPDDSTYKITIQRATYNEATGTWTTNTEATNTNSEAYIDYTIDISSNGLAYDYECDLEVLVGQRYYRVAKMYGKIKAIDDYYREGA